MNMVINVFYIDDIWVILEEVFHILVPRVSDLFVKLD